MSRRWSTMAETETAAVRRRFAAALAADELAAPEPPHGARPPRFDELYAAALDPVAGLGDALAGALADDAGARAEFEAIIRDVSVCWFPVAAAAAGGGGGSTCARSRASASGSVRRAPRTARCIC